MSRCSPPITLLLHAVWDTISFASNGLVFFWAGVASMNYFIRCEGGEGGRKFGVATPLRRSRPHRRRRRCFCRPTLSPSPQLCRSITILGNAAWSYAAIPFIYLFMMLIRTGVIALFNLTAFKWLKERECVCGRVCVCVGRGGKRRWGVDAQLAMPAFRGARPQQCA